MQEPKEWRQLNLPAETTYIEFPKAFTGKPRKGGKATVFTGLNLSCGFILALIHTANKMAGEPAKLTYEYIHNRLHMSDQTISAGLNKLEARGIIEEVARSKYRIKATYNKEKLYKVGDYLFGKEFYEVYEASDGKKTEKVKRLSYSRILALAFLQGMNENKKTDGVFISTNERVGKALHLPTSTAGDTLRELIAADLSRTEKYDGNDKRLINCRKFIVNPEVMAVKFPHKNTFYAPADEADELHKRFMLDDVYKGLMERIDANAAAYGAELMQSGMKATPALEKLEAETAKLRRERDDYLRKHNVDPAVFPPGFYKCDITDNNAI